MSYALTDHLPDYRTGPPPAPAGECEPWSAAQPSRCSAHNGVLCQGDACEAGCADEDHRATAWFERRVGDRIDVYSLRLCADCVASYGDELEQCAICGERYHTDVGGLTSGGVCYFCAEKEESK